MYTLKLIISNQVPIYKIYYDMPITIVPTL
jgi:hypothetical protein